MSGRSNRGGGRGNNGGGRGRSSGRDNNGGGRGSGSRGGGRGGGRGNSRQDRKAYRRAKQLETVNRKAEAEARVFWDKRKQAASSRSRPRPDTSARAAEAVFGVAGTAGINFDQYDAIEVVRTGLPPGYDVLELDSFQALTNPPWLQKNVSRMGYVRPTPIQRHAIPVALRGFDIMCCAQTGSGKTAAFLTPIACSFGSGSVADLLHQRTFGPEDPASPLALVLAPTRELASQIHHEAVKLCFGSGHRCLCVYGGASASGQLSQLALGVDILVATPGRLTDFIDRGVVSLAQCKFLVLDEADRMLDMGFEPQIRQIVQKRDLPARDDRSTFMFSATFPAQIQQLASEFMRPYVWIAVGRVGSTVDSITQRIVQLSAPSKQERLKHCVKALNETEGRTLVFVQKKATARWVSRQLTRLSEEGQISGRATAIHGDRSQSQREAALKQFRDGTARVLVATDVAARGLDVANVTHVINYTLPDEFDSYVHRIGRTGRAGHEGLATAFYYPGREKKVGNAKIAKDLLRLMQEGKQQIPAWFRSLPEVSGGRGSRGGNGHGPAQDHRSGQHTQRVVVQRGNGSGSGGGGGGNVDSRNKNGNAGNSGGGRNSQRRQQQPQQLHANGSNNASLATTRKGNQRDQSNSKRGEPSAQGSARADQQSHERRRQTEQQQKRARTQAPKKQRFHEPQRQQQQQQQQPPRQQQHQQRQQTKQQPPRQQQRQQTKQQQAKQPQQRQQQSKPRQPKQQQAKQESPQQVTQTQQPKQQQRRRRQQKNNKSQ